MAEASLEPGYHGQPSLVSIWASFGWQAAFSSNVGELGLESRVIQEVP
jgi:hypothetical protein